MELRISLAALILEVFSQFVSILREASTIKRILVVLSPDNSGDTWPLVVKDRPINSTNITIPDVQASFEKTKKRYVTKPVHF